MSKLCKKIMSLFCLAFVVGLTAVAAGIPPVQEASAASGDVNVQFKVNNKPYMAQIVSPAEDSLYYSVSEVTAKINYAMASSVTVYLTYPDGRYEAIHTETPSDQEGSFEVVLPVDERGKYTVSISGKDMGNNTMPGDARAFSYRAVTAETNDDGDKIIVDYGTDVCRLGFQVYKVSDTARRNPLLDPEYIIDVEQTGESPNVIEVEIPGFDKLGPDEFVVVVKGYACLTDEAIDSDDTNMNGIILPPQTGGINILGVTISQSDYLVTGLVVFVIAAAFAMILLGRRKAKKA